MSGPYMYDGAYSPDLATCKRHGAIAVSHYTTGRFASTSAQPHAIRAAGLGAVLNYEEGIAELVGASRAQGQAIGRRALAAVDNDCPRDGSVAYYFSVDTDVASGNLSACDNAFRGITDVLAGKFRPAVYGEGDLIDHLVNSGILHGKHWLSMSEGFGGFNAASKNVCMVQMHDAAGNWIGTDIPNTDRNTITDRAALGAWWPAGVHPAPVPTPIPIEEIDMSNSFGYAIDPTTLPPGVGGNCYFKEPGQAPVGPISGEGILGLAKGVGQPGVTKLADLPLITLGDHKLLGGAAPTPVVK